MASMSDCSEDSSSEEKARPSTEVKRPCRDSRGLSNSVSEALGLLRVEAASGAGVERKQCLVAFAAVAVSWALLVVQRVDVESELLQKLLQMGVAGEGLPFGSQVRRWLLLEFAIVLCRRWHAYLITSLGRVWQIQVTRSLHERYFADLTFYHARGLDTCERLTSDVPEMAQGLAHICCTGLSSLLRGIVVGVHLIWRAPAPWQLRWQFPVTVALPIVHLILWSTMCVQWLPSMLRRQQRQQGLEAVHREHYRRIQLHGEDIAAVQGEQIDEAHMQRHLAMVARHAARALPCSLLFDWVKELATLRLRLPLLAFVILAPLGRRARGAASGGAGVLGADACVVHTLWRLFRHQTQMLDETIQLMPQIMYIFTLARRVGEYARELHRRQRWQKDWDSLSWMEFGNCLAFHDATICTPSGHTLISTLSLEVKPGEDLLICGPSSVGKTAIARCLGALWPVLGGKVVRPVEGGIGGGRPWLRGGRSKGRRGRAGASAGLQGWSNGLAEDGAVVYLPRSPILPLGDCRDLREQIIAAPSGNHVSLSAASVAELDLLAEVVGLDHLSEGLGRDACLEHLQRLALARLLWRKPAFAILDGATSALPPADEDRLLEACRGVGITLVTVLQRPALQRHHRQVLTLLGDGRWRLEALAAPAQEPAKAEAAPARAAPALAALRAPAVPRPRRMSSFGSCSRRPSDAETGDLMALHSQASRTSHYRLSRMAAARPLEQFLAQMRLQAKLAVCLRWISPGEILALAMTLILGVVGAWAGERSTSYGALALRAAVERRDRLRAFVPRLLCFAVVQAGASSAAKHLGAAAALGCRRRLCSELLRRCLRPRRLLRLAQRLGSETGSVEHVLAEDVKAVTSGTWQLTVDAVRKIADVAVSGSALLRLILRDRSEKSSILDAEAFRLGTTLAMMLTIWSTLPSGRCLEPAASQTAVPDAALLQGHAQLRREAEAVAFAHTQARRWIEIEASWKSAFAEQRLHRWQSAILSGLRHALGRSCSIYVFWLLCLLYRRSRGSSLPVRDVAVGVEYLWMASARLSASLGVLLWQLRGRWSELLKPGVRVWRLIEALEAVEREEAQVSTGRQARMDGHSEGIVLEDADIWDPEGGTKPIAIRLSLSVQPDLVGLAICGPEGCGKGAIARTLCGLLTVEVGIVRLPAPSQIHLLKPRPYLPVGTLVDQVTYPVLLSTPLRLEDRKRLWEAVQGARLEDLFESVKLGEVSDKWGDSLSLERQQRLAFARLLWHKPDFAVLEAGCTSALHLGAEERILAACRRVGITIVQVLHRQALVGSHTRLLFLEGGGRWRLESLPRGSGGTGSAGCGGAWVPSACHGGLPDSGGTAIPEGEEGEECSSSSCLESEGDASRTPLAAGHARAAASTSAGES